MRYKIIDFVMDATLVILAGSLGLGVVGLLMYAAVEFTRYLQGGC